MARARDVHVTWLGGTTVVVRSPSGKSLLVDPLPDAGGEGVDAVLLTSSGSLAGAATIARARSLPVVALPDAARWLEKNGVGSALSLNLGGSLDVLGVRVTMVRAEHLAPLGDGLSGVCCGYFLTFGNGVRIYHAGLTGLFGDMALLGEIYRPDLVLLPVGEADILGPPEAAHAVRLLRARRVVPLVARPALSRALRAHLDELGLEKVVLAELSPGQTLS